MSHFCTQYMLNHPQEWLSMIFFKSSVRIFCPQDDLKKQSVTDNHYKTLQISQKWVLFLQGVNDVLYNPGVCINGHSVCVQGASMGCIRMLHRVLLVHLWFCIFQVKMVSAGLAGIISDLITFPLDTAKVRLQVCVPSENSTVFSGGSRIS